MKRIFSFLITFLVFFNLSGLVPPAIASPSCPITISPPDVSTNEKSVDVVLDGSGILSDDSTYYVKDNGSPIQVDSQLAGPSDKPFKPSNGKITIEGLDGIGFVGVKSGGFKPITYDLSVENLDRNTTYCTASFPVSQATSGGTCEISFTNQSFTTKDNITVKATNLGGKPADGRRLIIKRIKENGDEAYNQCTNVGALSSGYPTKRLESGLYYVEIRNGCEPAARLCYNYFGVGVNGGFVSPGPHGTPKPICSKYDATGKNCLEVQTGLGAIFTDPAGFVKSLFGIVLSLSGGVAIVLIIISGYSLMFSQGNPEKVQAAREQLTAAIVGLLFIIFSMSILQIIGVDILHIPGLGK